MTDNTADMARELEGMIRGGTLDPSLLLAGQWRFHSVFVAPFTPSFEKARSQFLADGSGPLAGTVEQLMAQGLKPEDAVSAARKLMESAQGLCVTVLAGDHGVSTVPQPFYGHISAEWVDGASRVTGPRFQAAVAAALESLASGSPAWPNCVAGPALVDGDIRGYWLELAHGAASVVELSGARIDSRLADLGLWVLSAVTSLGPEGLDGDDHAALVRCALAAGNPVAACSGIEAAVAAGNQDGLVEMLDSLAIATCSKGGIAEVEAWLAGPGAALAAAAGCAYDGALARLRVVAAAGAGDDRLRPAVDALFAADRKLARQALTREPVWEVVAADPGELVDTAAAADLIGRSPAFVSKRLEAGTIPYHAADGLIRLPKRALLAWKAALDANKALD